MYRACTAVSKPPRRQAALNLASSRDEVLGHDYEETKEDGDAHRKLDPNRRADGAASQPQRERTGLTIPECSCPLCFARMRAGEEVRRIVRHTTPTRHVIDAGIR
jgi:hypothetical protein